MTTPQDNSEPLDCRVLFVPLCREYFEAFERGEKHEEFRPYGPRWNERTCRIGRQVVLSLGYGKSRRLFGRVVSFRTDSEPQRMPAWLHCYGDKHPVAACIGVALDLGTNDYRELPPPTMPKNTTESYGG